MARNPIDPFDDEPIERPVPTVSLVSQDEWGDVDVEPLVEEAIAAEVAYMEAPMKHVQGLNRYQQPSMKARMAFDVAMAKVRQYVHERASRRAETTTCNRACSVCARNHVCEG